MELIKMLIKRKLAHHLEQAILEAQRQGSIANTILPDVVIERPQNIEHGDYASSIALKLARSARISPLEIANRLLRFIPKTFEIEDIRVIPPGFINFILSRAWLANEVDNIFKNGESWGNINIGENRLIQVEFVSVNPTGPLHVGHGRGAVLGSTLANVLKAAGYRVQTEYYINNAGSQLDAFKRSLFVRYQQSQGLQKTMPSDGYMGSYMVDLAHEIKMSHRIYFDKIVDEDQLVQELGNIGFHLIMDKIRYDLESLGIKFDVWFSEKSLNENNIYANVIAYLRKNNFTVERDKAVWFTSISFGEDKDNVLIRSDNTPTYFAYDIAYHYNKFIIRKFDTVIDVWGADHQGHVARMKAAMSALGINPDNLKIVICQLVTLKRGEEVVRFSKRSGDFITLREVIDEVGLDACRFVFLSRSAASQMDFDMDLAKKQSSDNPVYYVQYAHARISSILKLAHEKDIEFAKGNVSLLTSEPEVALIKQMILLPEIIELAASVLEPHHLPYYAIDLATAFHSFYKQCRVITNNREKTMSRLKLVKSTQIILAKVLHLMGMTAPDAM